MEERAAAGGKGGGGGRQQHQSLPLIPHYQTTALSKPSWPLMSAAHRDDPPPPPPPPPPIPSVRLTSSRSSLLPLPVPQPDHVSPHYFCTTAFCCYSSGLSRQYYSSYRTCGTRHFSRWQSQTSSSSHTYSAAPPPLPTLILRHPLLFPHLFCCTPSSSHTYSAAPPPLPTLILRHPLLFPHRLFCGTPSSSHTYSAAANTVQGGSVRPVSLT